MNKMYIVIACEMKTTKCASMIEFLIANGMFPHAPCEIHHQIQGVLEITVLM